MQKIFYFLSILSILLNSSASVYATSGFDSQYFNLNDIIYYDAGSEECFSSTSGSSELVGNDNAEKVWNFLKGKGLKDFQIAGIMGGLYGESNGFNPDLNEVGSGIGYGIAQWSFGRRTNLENYAKEKGKPVSDLGLQLDFLWYELETSYKSDLDIIKSASDIQSVVKQWVGDYGWGFERPAAQYVAARNEDGVKWGNDFLKLYGGKSSSSSTSSTSQSSSTSSSSSGGSYTFIGDSLTVGVQDAIKSSFSSSNVNAVTGRGISQAGQGGGSIMDYLNSNPSLNDDIVINIGANDTFPLVNAKAMLEKLKDKKVYLVNSYSGTNFNETNKNIESISKEFSNIIILDWKSYVDSNGGKEKNYTNSDGMNFVHMSEDGKGLYIKFLQEKLNGNSSSSSSGSCSESNGKFSSSTNASYQTEDGFSVFSQYDSRWADKPGNGGTRGNTSCGPFSLITIISALTGKTPDVDDLVQRSQKYNASPGGTTYEVAKLATEYGLKSNQISATIEDVNKALDSGGLILISGRGSRPFMGGGHWIVIRKKTSGGKWKIAQVGGTSEEYQAESNKDWDPSFIMSMADQSGVFNISK